MTKPACPYCKIVNTLCFWGPRPYARWKRPTLFFASVLLTAGFGALAWWMLQRPGNGLTVVLSGLLALVGVLGVAVALHGCNACVARLFGEV